jgi:hypothetical protein
MNEATSAAPAAAAKNVEKVKMSDGREVEFVGPKKKMVKEAMANGKTIDQIAEGEDIDWGSLAVRLDFRNGTTRTYPLNPNLLTQFALHGALQKYGDALAGGVKNEDGSESEDLDDYALVTDDLHEQLSKGDWRAARDASGFGGTSDLVKAICEVKGKTPEAVKAFLKDKKPKEKAALSLSPLFAPVIERLKKEKATKAAASVDTSALLAELG